MRGLSRKWVRLCAAERTPAASRLSLPRCRFAAGAIRPPAAVVPCVLGVNAAVYAVTAFWAAAKTSRADVVPATCSVPSTPRSIHPAFTASNISSAGPVWPFGMPNCSNASAHPARGTAKASRRASGIERRGLIRDGLSLGALVMLTGCDVKRPEAVEFALLAISRFNDDVQALLFDPSKLAPTYPASMILRPPRASGSAAYGRRGSRHPERRPVGTAISCRVARLTFLGAAAPRETRATRHHRPQGFRHE